MVEEARRRLNKADQVLQAGQIHPHRLLLPQRQLLQASSKRLLANHHIKGRQRTTLAKLEAAHRVDTLPQIVTATDRAVNNSSRSTIQLITPASADILFNLTASNSRNINSNRDLAMSKALHHKYSSNRCNLNLNSIHKHYSKFNSSNRRSHLQQTPKELVVESVWTISTSLLCLVKVTSVK
jgi:hypothetical protein